MNEISLAIPCYNTSKYFEEATKLAIESDLVKEIVVSDDCSTDDEWQKLNSIIKNLGSAKIKLFRNEKNLGGFRNKYNVVKHCTSDWVYLLDSDNHPTEDTLRSIASIENPNPNYCYLPQTLMMYKDDGYTDQITYNFKYSEIGIDEAQDALIKKTKYIDWMLNTGNFVFNRELYLSRLRSAYNNPEEPCYACSVAFSYHWMARGGVYKVVEGMKYYHRLRNDSYWNTCGNNSSLSRDYYQQRIINLS
tara:strand:- start:1991 stop:2734 length:744 start_codon:yes stop_codon:yes gene_type:complete